MNSLWKISITWKQFENEKVCTATAFDNEGYIIAKTSVTVPYNAIESYMSHESLDDEEIETVAKIELESILPERYNQ